MQERVIRHGSSTMFRTSLATRRDCSTPAHFFCALGTFGATPVEGIWRLHCINLSGNMAIIFARAKWTKTTPANGNTNCIRIIEYPVRQLATESASVFEQPMDLRRPTFSQGQFDIVNPRQARRAGVLGGVLPNLATKQACYGMTPDV